MSNSFDDLRYLCDHLNATDEVKKVKSICAQKLTQNLGAYFIRCAIMTRGIFEVGDAFEKNDARLTKDMNQLKDDLKVQTDKVEELNKQLSETKKQKETSVSQLSKMMKQKEIDKSKCSELEATNSYLTHEAE